MGAVWQGPAQQWVGSAGATGEHWHKQNQTTGDGPAPQNALLEVVFTPSLEAQALRFGSSSPACHGEAGMNFMAGEFSGFNN